MKTVKCTTIPKNSYKNAKILTLQTPYLPNEPENDDMENHNRVHNQTDDNHGKLLPVMVCCIFVVMSISYEIIHNIYNVYK